MSSDEIYALLVEISNKLWKKRNGCLGKYATDNDGMCRLIEKTLKSLETGGSHQYKPIRYSFISDTVYLTACNF